jgi:hypothetical protein
LSICNSWRVPRGGVAEIELAEVSRQIVLRHPPFRNGEFIQADGDGRREILRVQVDRVVLRRVRIIQVRESRIEIANGEAHILGVAGVSQPEIQRPVVRKIDATIRGRRIQKIGEAAGLAVSVFGERASEVKMRPIDPLDLRRCAITGLHQEKVRTRSCAVERQPPFWKKAMGRDGKQSQYDPDQQEG